jgi:hypothetical protein
VNVPTEAGAAHCALWASRLPCALSGGVVCVATAAAVEGGPSTQPEARRTCLLWPCKLGNTSEVLPPVSSSSGDSVGANETHQKVNDVM